MQFLRKTLKWPINIQTAKFLCSKTIPFFHPAGGSAVGVPGNVKGLWTVHLEYGKISWFKLLQPSIDLAKNGFKITKTIDRALERVRSGKYKSVDAGLRLVL